MADWKVGRLLVDTFSGGFELDEDEDEADIPEEIESILEGLFKRLQDRVGFLTSFITQHFLTQTTQDTIVRWSAAKGTARIASRLPSSFADQVLDTIIKLFSIHSLAAANIYDLPAIAESTWHGACLALAEMARRGLVSEDKLLEVMGWLSKVHIVIFGSFLFSLRHRRSCLSAARMVSGRPRRAASQEVTPKKKHIVIFKSIQFLYDHKHTDCLLARPFTSISEKGPTPLAQAYGMQQLTSSGPSPEHKNPPR